MARPRKTPEGQVQVRILADGVFIADDQCCDKGDTAMVEPGIADNLIENGHAERV